MLIGVPKEIKNHEYRVAMSPAGVRELSARGHSVLVEAGAGEGSGFSDEDFRTAGAAIADSAAAVFAEAEMILKVKEPQDGECRQLKEGQTLFTFLHLAPDPEQTALLIDSGATCIAYETITDDSGSLPLLAPMSEIAGRMSIQEGAWCLEKARGGCGVLLGGVPGVEPANVVVIGGGVVGLNAARMAYGLGAHVTILDRSLPRLRQIDEMFNGRLRTVYSTTDSIEKHLATADLVIGAVLIPGAAAPKLVTRKMLSILKPGAVLVDVAIDQGGCFETSHPTTHENPIYEVDGIVHYCVANMPGAVARTSTLALTNATLPYVSMLADQGITTALKNNPHLLNGLNVHRGQITSQVVAEALNYSFCPPLQAIDA
ncbi:alanine dehydrogenase [Gilvimarinus sp. F26214L]|uniref:alanine dehydrogenase n=1 Tax=Gilvimarinus sp. DZF01 TaxID=3461371 RepID=UPI00404687E5